MLLDVQNAARKVAEGIKVEPAAVMAAIEVESGGQTFAVVDGRNEPLIRFEGHYFYRRLSGSERDKAVAVGLASPKAGAVKNPRSQASRWDLLNRAAEIDAEAAFESISIGVGQVMVAHWQWLEYESATAMVNEARGGINGQILQMFKYIQKAGLIDALRRKDWHAFARGYNGPAYAKQGYHTKLAAAYAKFAGRGSPPSESGILKLGSRGAGVREVQALLVRAGYTIKVDGDFGPSTVAAVKAFQTSAGIKADGMVGPQTMRALESLRQGPDDKPGHQAPTDVVEVRDAAKGVGLLSFVTAMRDQVAEAAMWLTGIEAETAQTVANALMAGSAILGACLAAYAIVGYLRSRRTVE